MVELLARTPPSGDTQVFLMLVAVVLLGAAAAVAAVERGIVLALGFAGLFFWALLGLLVALSVP